MLGLHFCARAFSSCGERGPLFIAVRGPLPIAASLVAEHRLQTRRLSSCGSQAQLLQGMWDLPRPGLEPVSPALAGRFSTTAPPGKPPLFFNVYLLKYIWASFLDAVKLLGNNLILLGLTLSLANREQSNVQIRVKISPLLRQTLFSILPVPILMRIFHSRSCEQALCWPFVLLEDFPF